MRHAGIKKYVCPYCGIGKTTRQEWTQHINHAHTQEKRYTCELCPHSTYNRQNLRLHVRVVHHGIKDYACQFCGKQFGKSHACKMHEMIHTGEKRCECNVCGRQFLYAKALARHLKTHQKRVLRAIQVLEKRKDQVADQTSENQQQSAELTEGSNAGTPSGNRSLEEETRVAKELLKFCEESAIKAPKDFRRVPLNQEPCSSNSIPQDKLQIANYMMSEGTHVCDICFQGFNGPANLKRHIRVVHDGIKDYACRYCEKRFSKAQILRNHEMTHTGRYILMEKLSKL